MAKFKQNRLFHFRVKWIVFYCPLPNLSKIDKFDTKFSPTRTEALHHKRSFLHKTNTFQCTHLSGTPFGSFYVAVDHSFHSVRPTYNILPDNTANSCAKKGFVNCFALSCTAMKVFLEQVLSWDYLLCASKWASLVACCFPQMMMWNEQALPILRVKKF